jgi:putative transposase
MPFRGVKNGWPAIAPNRHAADAVVLAQPTRRRERIMKRFKSPRHVQRFLSAHDQLANVFPRRREDDTAVNLRSGRTQAFATRADVTGVAMAA